MAMLPGYEYDIFVSYARTDDADPDGRAGWVSQFMAHLETALRQRLGKHSDTLGICFDVRVVTANSQLQELPAAATRSALFLLAGSPSYATRAWPLQELGAFVHHAADLSRLFMIESLPLNDGESYPPCLEGHYRMAFWKRTGPHGIPRRYSPASEEFGVLVDSLADDLRRKLTSLGVGAASRGASLPAAVARKTILLAQATDDVDDEVDQLRRYLGQYEERVLVLPRACYPQGGEAFRAAFAEDLAQAGLFVQVLGRRAGRTPPDLPEGYTRFQLATARAAGVEIMQWRHPALDLESVSDSAYAALLTAETVTACGLEAFKGQVLDWARRPEPKPRAAPGMVFIDADRNDLSIAQEIARECNRHDLWASVPMVGPSSEENRMDLEESLTACDVLLFIYGDTTPAWIRAQLLQFSKVRHRREAEPRLLAICTGPPAEKPEIGTSPPRTARIIALPHSWSVEPIWQLIAEALAS